MNDPVFLGIGSNVGDREANLAKVLRELEKKASARIVRSSGIYETDPYGLKDQPRFLNCVVQIRTGLKPRGLLNRITNIELDMGRARIEKWGPRIIDVDILFFGDLIVNEPGLTIPHSDCLNRGFVMIPMAEIAPVYVPPGTSATIAELADRCPDGGRVERLKALTGEPTHEA